MNLKFVSVLLAPFIPLATAVHPLKVQGSNFIDTVSNQRFEIIGVDYQPDGSAGYKPQSGTDPLSNGTACLRDATIMQSLGLNCIRVYNLDPDISHDDCASIFNAAGIYMIIDVNSPLPNESIDASQPWASYSSVYLKRIFSVVEAFKNYPNLLGFFGGNEVVNDFNSGSIDPPYIRAVTRDLKNYIAKHSTRSIPVGYSAADVREILVDTWEYLQCAIDGKSNDPSRIDFFGLNSYSWCGATANYQNSGYQDLTSDFSKTTVPIFFSEYGCNKPEGETRLFNEVQALYGDEMRAVMSGGLVYEWTQEDNDFGLVTINANASLSLRSDFDSLQGQLNKLNIKAVQATNSTATTLNPPTCSTGIITDSQFSSNFTIPDVPKGGQDLINNGVSGAKTGKTVQVSATAMPVAVYASAGKPLSNLKLSVLPDDASNTPNGGSTGGTSTTSGGSSGTSNSPAASSSSGVAVAVEVKNAGILVAGLLGVLML